MTRRVRFASASLGLRCFACFPLTRLPFQLLRAPTCAQAGGDTAMGAPRVAGPGGAVAYAPDSPVTFASRTGPEGLPVGVLYNGTAVKNATEARGCRLRVQRMRQQ